MYNIFDIAAVTVEREYQLPEHWSNAVIGFNQNTAPLTDNSASSEALFYPDPSNRILVITARTPPLGASHSLFRNWLFINESYFRPTSRRDRLSVPWDQWKEYCLIKDVSPSALISDPCVIGSRVLYVESDSGRNPSRGGHPSGCASRLTIIDFAPYPDASCHSNSVWPFVGKRSLLVPNENTRSVPSKTVDRLSIDDIRVTEDNIVLFLVRHRFLFFFSHYLILSYPLRKTAGTQGRSISSRLVSQCRLAHATRCTLHSSNDAAHHHGLLKYELSFDH